MARPRVPLPFGGGIDRSAGTMVVESTSFRDLRNVSLAHGKAQARRGLAERATLAGESAILAVESVRSQGVGVVVAYDTATREVTLYRVDADGTNPSLIGVLWTLPADRAFPRVVTAASYDKVFIAHDEGTYAHREPTQVYDLIAGTLGPLTADLDGNGAAVAVRFRGVCRHLNYLLGWGYGSEVAGEENRPEIVRVSKAGEPTVFVKQHYWIAGQRGDPVLSVRSVGNVATVRKLGESYTITGYDQQTFGIQPSDPLFGIAGSRLSVVVGGVEYFWSHDGPMAAVLGGPAEDMGHLLDLDGLPPDALAVVSDPASGLAVYHPGERAVEFIFGRWGFVLHLTDGVRRWSYREYPFEVAAGGLLYVAAGTSGSGSVAPTAYPEATAATAGAITAGEPDDAPLTVDYTLVGALSGGEVVELWAKPHYGTDGWRKLGQATATSPTGSVTAPSSRFATFHDLAVRVVLNGLATAGYTSADPANWPASARTSATTQQPATTLALGAWSRVSAAVERIAVTRTGAGASHPEITARLERSLDGGGTWGLVVERDATQPVTEAEIASGEGERTIHYRYREAGPGATGPWTASASRWAGPSTPTAVGIVATALNGTYTVSWTNSPEYTDGVTEVSVENSGAPGWGPMREALYPDTQEPASTTCGAGDVQGRARHRQTTHGVTDYSDYGYSGTVPSNC